MTGETPGPAPLTGSGPTDEDEKRRIAELEVDNGFRQFDYALWLIETYVKEKRPFNLRPSMIRELQRIAVDGIISSPGEYRGTPVEITGSAHQPPAAFRVEALVQEMCDYVNNNLHEKSPFHLAAYIMWRLNWIHPFPDGNGRTSRTASYMVLSMHLGYELPGSPPIPHQIEQDRTRYIEALEAADAASTDEVIDVSAMEELLKAMLANQLLSVITSAEQPPPKN